MSDFVAAMYIVCVGLCAWRIWRGDQSRALVALFSLSVLFLLNALHWGFIFTNEIEGAITSFGAALRFSFAEIPAESTFGVLVKYAVIRLCAVLLAGYAAFFAWQNRTVIKEALKKETLQKPLIAGAVFLSLSVMGIMTGAVLVHVLAAITWGAVIYLWPKSA